MKKKVATRSSLSAKANSGTARSRSEAGSTDLFHAVGHDQRKFPPITAEEFDRRFDAGEELTEYFGETMTPAEFQRYLEKHGVQVPAGR